MTEIVSHLGVLQTQKTELLHIELSHIEQPLFVFQEAYSFILEKGYFYSPIMYS